MTEKTYPVNVGEEVRAKILKIQKKVVEIGGFEPTQRQLVERAITEYYERLFKEEEKEYNLV